MGYFEIPKKLSAAIAVLLIAIVGVSWLENAKTNAVLLAQAATKSVVVIECRVPEKHETLTSAGFVATENGHILTVAHGLAECMGTKQRNLIVRFWDNPELPHRAIILRMDAKKDAAILQVPSIPSNIPPLDIDTSVQKPGTPVIAIGHPELFYWSVSQGIVSADRLWRSPFRHLIQVTATISPGNSGGPVLNDSGKVIGVVSFYIDNNHSLSFLIPMDTFVFLARGLNL